MSCECLELVYGPRPSIEFVCPARSIEIFPVAKGLKGDAGDKGDPGDPGPPTTDASLLSTGTVSEPLLPSGINANKIANGLVSNVEFQYLDGLTSNIQSQFTSASDALTTGLATKANASHTHSAATELTGVLPLAKGGTGRANTVSTTIGIGAYTGTGTGNVVIGGFGTAAALTTAGGNTIVGSGAGAIATASNNTFYGMNAGASTVNGTLNTLLGFSAGQNFAAATSNCSAVGYNALRYNTSSNNTAFGYSAGQGASGTTTAAGLTLFGYLAGAAIQSGGNNTIFGYSAGAQLVSQTSCTLIGWNAGGLNGGNNNTAVGSQALYQASGVGNVAVGNVALFSVTTGATNTAVGYAACQYPATGIQNVCVGGYAGQGSSTLSDYQGCTFVGYSAGTSNRTAGNSNTFVGKSSGNNNQTGTGNCYYGVNSGYFNVTGSNNTAIGLSALALSGATAISQSVAVGSSAMASSSGNNCTAVGFNCLNGCTGVNNVSIGMSSGGVTTGTNNVIIGTAVTAQVATESYQTNINNTFRRSGTAGAASKTSKAAIYGNGIKQTVIPSVKGRRGRIQFFDSSDGWCTVRFNPTSLAIEGGSSEYVTGAPEAGQIQVALAGSVLWIVLGDSGAARSIGWSVDDIEFF